MYKKTENYPIKNTQVYQFPDGTYHVSFDAHNMHHVFNGTREQVLPGLSLRVKRILHVR
ncbi:MAG: hypothetical protein IKP24_02125 [Alphaproteobacteria bacterium]|nr:hypothetical protein [Alphaproteobacteria bacterium]